METLSTLVFYDLETTGFSSKYNGIHEIGLTTLQGDALDIRVRPWGMAESAALAVCRKTLEEISAYPPEAEGVAAFAAYIRAVQAKYRKPVRLIGYCNKRLDDRFLLAALTRNGLRIMGLKLTLNSLDLRDCLVNSKVHNVRGLAKMAFRYGVAVEPSKLHGASYDAGLTSSLFKKVYGWKG